MTSGQHATFAFMVFLNISLLPIGRLISLLLDYHLSGGMARSRIAEISDISLYVLSGVSLLVTFLVAVIQAVSAAVDAGSFPLILSVALIFLLLIIPILTAGALQDPLTFHQSRYLNFFSKRHIYSLLGGGLTGAVWILTFLLLK